MYGRNFAGAGLEIKNLQERLNKMGQIQIIVEGMTASARVADPGPVYF